LTLKDMDQAAVVLRAAFDAQMPNLAGLHTPREDRQYFRDHVFKESEIWGAIDGDITGILALGGIWINHLYVLPEHQGKGIGLSLLDHAKKMSPGTLVLWTFQQNAIARKFYEKNGFTAIEKTDGSRNEEKAPDVLYRWDRAPQ
jgi:putative acetyltransferase